MRQRLETLRRLASLYAVIEEMHQAELHRMTVGVHEVIQAIVVEQDVAKLARIDGRCALATGDCVGWMMSGAQREASVWRRQRMEQVREEREQLKDEATQRYVASRLKREQMKRVFNEISARSEIEEGRRAQAVSDDRFLGRRRWTGAREKMRADKEMKTS